MLTDNFVLSKFMGICPFLGVSKKLDSATGMGVAVTCVMLCATCVTYPIHHLILVPNGLEYFDTVVFILVIALFVQLVETMLKKCVPSLYKSLGVYLPLIVVNCIILGRAEMFASKNGVAASALDGLGMGIGFTAALFIMGSIREILGAGSWFGLSIPIISSSPMLIFILPPGGFFFFFMLMAAANKLNSKPVKKQKDINCAACPMSGNCNKLKEGKECG